MFEDIYSWIVSLEASNYTVVQTILYALLVLLGLYLLYRWIRKVNIEISTPLMLSALTYVLFGGLLRVVEDTGTIPDPWWILFITPQVYILTLIFGMLALFVSYLLQKKKVVLSYIPVFAGIGTAASVLAFLYLMWFGFYIFGQFFQNQKYHMFINDIYVISGKKKEILAFVSKFNLSSFVDTVRIDNNVTCCCLPKNLSKHYHRISFGFNQVTQYLPRSDTRKLIDIPHQNQSASQRNRL